MNLYMKQIVKHLLPALFFFASANLMAQTLPGIYRTTWAGNTYGKGLSPDRQNGKWVQDFIQGAAVSPGGMVYTTSEWDEGGRNAGIYGGKIVDGVEIGNVYGCLAVGACVNETGHVGREYAPDGMAVAANGKNAYAVFHSLIYKYTLQGCNGTKFKDHSADAMYATENRLLTVQNSGSVHLYDLSRGAELANFILTKPGPCTIDKNGNLWIVTGLEIGDLYGRKGTFFIKQTGISPVVKHLSPTGTELGDDITGESNWWPTSLAIDNTGKLMVCDAGARMQVLFYDISATPNLVATFGQPGGIAAGTPGVMAPDKFFGTMYAGTDTIGNLYVACEGMGQLIRKYDTIHNLVWELNGLGFVESADFDPTTDGADIYTPNEHFKFDNSKTKAGTEWSPYSYNIDRNKYPSDKRITSWKNSAVIRNINGQRIMFVYTMAGGAAITIYKFDNEIAVECGSLDPGSWAAMPDKNADIWYVNNNNIYKKNFIGFDGSGIPGWGPAQLICVNPGAIGEIQRIEYISGEDVLYITGDIPSGDWGIIGTKMEKWTGFLNGSRTKAWISPIPYSQKNEVPGKLRQKAICFAGDYIFSVGVESRCKVWVYNASDGKVAGFLDPGPEVNGVGATGWVDVPYGIRAIKRLSGEYSVLVEEDGFAKILIFRWSPSGD